MLHAAWGTELKYKNYRSGRVQSVSSPPFDARSPSSYVVASSLLPAQFPPRTSRLRRCVSWWRLPPRTSIRIKHCCSATAALKDARIVGDHAYCAMYNPALSSRQSFAAARSTKKVSLFEGESGLPPATMMLPTCSLQACRICLAACLIEATKEKDRVPSSVFL